jgi:hypothetical protein
VLVMQGEPQDLGNISDDLKLGAQHLMLFLFYHFKFARYISDLKLGDLYICFKFDSLCLCDWYE